MGKRSSKDYKVYAVGGYDFRGHLTRLGVRREHSSESRFPFGEVAEAHQPVGVSRATINQAGWFDDGTKGTITAFLALENTQVPVLVNGAGGTQGSFTRLMSGALVHDPGEAVGGGELVKWDHTLNVAGKIYDGQLALPYTTVTGNGNSSYDTGETETEDGAVVHIQVHDAERGTATSLVITVSEGNGSTWVELANYTLEEDGQGAYQVEVPDVTVGTHLKVAWTWGGGAGGGSTARIVVGVARL